ncbi:hypothetical protein N1851_016149 [Merluccius polli]|uniref:C2H2-type domain-containing protein n=1 Tax=Merluccius polli TaxID=89951 RepID=A0AA47MQU3_MERPO|nr:hypothetical protein N1851_016149 [Merluccius polli]
MKEGLETKCPFRGCDQSYTVASSFASHVSRKHTTGCVEDLDDGVFDRSVPTEPLSQHEASQSCSDISDENHESEMPLAVDETLFLQNLTLLYLKLQAKLLLPASTIQTIIEDFQNAHEIGLSHSHNILSEKLKALGIPEATVSKSIDEINKGNLLKLYNRGVLSTDIKRKVAFKKNFNYVEPVPLFLGIDENGKDMYLYWRQSESVREQYAATRLQPSTDNVYQDVRDGEGVQSNVLFKTDPSSVGLILYQDSFEVVNPLGSGGKKHKVLAVYSTLTDILPHNRSITNQMQLVLLCREKDFKYFGMSQVFEPLIKDLQVLEERGIVISDGSVVKGTLVAISGDNLGSHSVGGFLENFSRANHFCRYCEIDRDTFVNQPQLSGTTRTAQSYQGHLQALKTSDTDSECGIKIKDPCDNEVWQLILQLREIVELVCAPAITAGQVAYLKVIIEEYLYFRKKLIPDHALKPKHHYLCHYPELIGHFGPLIRLWTLRFESKHTFFKQCARKLHNFRNLCKTLAERHQLLQAYLSAGNLFPPPVQIEKGTEFYMCDYNDKIRASVASCEFESQSAVACNSVKVKGTVYKKGMFVLLGHNAEELYFGKINLAIVLQDSVHFVTEKHTFVKLTDMGIYCQLGEAQEDYVCIKHEHLLDYYPLPVYKLCDLSVIALHHSFSEAV